MNIGNSRRGTLVLMDSKLLTLVFENIDVISQADYARKGSN
jgi:hypothetical protein